MEWSKGKLMPNNKLREFWIPIKNIYIMGGQTLPKYLRAIFLKVFFPLAKFPEGGEGGKGPSKYFGSIPKNLGMLPSPKEVFL